MAHYKLTPDRKTFLQNTLNTALAKRVYASRAAFDLTENDLLTLAFTDHEREVLAETASFYHRGLQRTEHIQLWTTVEANGGRFVVMMQAKLPHMIYWPFVSMCSVYSNSYPLHMRCISRFGYEHMVEAGGMMTVRAHDPRYVDVVQRFNAWATEALNTLRRADLGFQVVDQLFKRATMLTNIVAMLPDVRALLRDRADNKEQGNGDRRQARELLTEMDKAPRRTIRDYRLSDIEHPRILALQHLIAESLVLPDYDPLHRYGWADVTQLLFCPVPPDEDGEG